MRPGACQRIRLVASELGVTMMVLRGLPGCALIVVAALVWVAAVPQSCFAVRLDVGNPGHRLDARPGPFKESVLAPCG